LRVLSADSKTIAHPFTSLTESHLAGFTRKRSINFDYIFRITNLKLKKIFHIINILGQYRIEKATGRTSYYGNQPISLVVFNSPRLIFDWRLPIL
jgi:hypothetical protein